MFHDNLFSWNNFNKAHCGSKWKFCIWVFWRVCQQSSFAWSHGGHFLFTITISQTPRLRHKCVSKWELPSWVRWSWSSAHDIQSALSVRVRSCEREESSRWSLIICCRKTENLKRCSSSLPLASLRIFFPSVFRIADITLDLSVRWTVSVKNSVDRTEFLPLPRNKSRIFIRVYYWRPSKTSKRLSLSLSVGCFNVASKRWRCFVFRYKGF